MREAMQAQEVLSQSSFYSVNDRRLHFGLGAATHADLEIRWPRGAVQKLPHVPADQVLVVSEPRNLRSGVILSIVRMRSGGDSQDGENHLPISIVRGRIIVRVKDGQGGRHR